MSALLSFLSGSLFRGVLSQVTSFIEKKQEHKHELERIGVQSKVDSETHARNMASLRLQSELGVRTIEATRDSDVSRAEADAFRAAVSQPYQLTGVKWLDAVNQSVRPAYAYVGLFLWELTLWRQGFIMNDWDKELMAVIVGFFFVDRMLGKNKK